MRKTVFRPKSLFLLSRIAAGDQKGYLGNLQWLIEDIKISEKCHPNSLVNELVSAIQSFFDPVIIYGGYASFQCGLVKESKHIDIGIVSTDMKRDIDTLESYLLHDPRYHGRYGMTFHSQSRHERRHHLNVYLDGAIVHVWMRQWLGDPKENEEKRSHPLNVVREVVDPALTDITRCVGISLDKRYDLWVNLNGESLDHKELLFEIRKELSKTCRNRPGEACRDRECAASLERICNMLAATYFIDKVEDILATPFKSWATKHSELFNMLQKVLKHLRILGGKKKKDTTQYINPNRNKCVQWIAKYTDCRWHKE